MPVVYISTLGRRSDVMMQLISGETGICKDTLSHKGQLTNDHWTVIEENLKDICDAPLHIVTKPLYSLGELSLIIKCLVNEKNVKSVYIDNVESFCGEPRCKTLNLDFVLSYLKHIATRFNIAIIATHTYYGDNILLPDDEPTIWSLRNSGCSEKFADKVVFIHKLMNDDFDSPYVGKAKIIVAKNMNGGLGDVCLNYYVDRQRFEEIADNLPCVNEIESSYDNNYRNEDFK